MSEAKRRKMAHLSAKLNEGQREKQPDCVSQKPRWMDLRTASSLLPLLMCIGLTWFLFQQSAHLAAVEEKYHLLNQDAVKFQDMENKINIMFEKFESSSGILREIYSSSSMMTKSEQELPSLHNIMEEVENSEQIHSKKIQSINEKFENAINHWKRNGAELDTSSSSLKSEAKLLHGKVTSQINTADQKLKSLSERLKDLEDSTVRNLRTVNRQEEEELTKIKEQLHFDGKATEKLEEQHNSLLARNTELSQKLADYEPKLEECKSHLPTIEKAVHSVVRLSSELIAVEKKMENMTIKLFYVEDEIKKAVSDIMGIQKNIEGMQCENSMLQFQKEIFALKEKVNEFSQSTAEESSHSMNVTCCEKTANSMEQMEDLHKSAQMKHLQEEINTVKIQSERLIQEENKLQQNLTSLFHAVNKYEETTASAAKEFSVKIATVKTDIRRISGLEADVTLLIENLRTLEDKVDKAEKTTIQSIGNLLTNSIDRTTELRNTATENARQIERIKAKSSELNVDLNKQSNKLLDLESDRAKVLTTVAFANDLKPKVHNLKRGLAHLEPMLDELTLRIGKLLEELQERKKEIAFLHTKLVETEVRTYKQ
ncbi:hypothetical protein JD844_028151 [Phrynosoma platyrhinos]|uniref:Inhibitor of nuclear factor kappa-B kinase-interacting protein n=1 Tax=Phrynosoma platyrhinos TaxID=52577 RepID=A0ABQ7SHG8_PHRPL|nr:hypothetical protein JD844_028151 [Phrynosoma platyrhinos]